MKQNEKNNKEIKFRKVNFKDAKKLDKKKKFIKKISFNNQDLPNKKNKNNNSIKTSAMISFLKNIRR